MNTPGKFWSARAVAALMTALPAMAIVAPTAAHAQFSIGLDIRVGYPPPPLPIYEQPPLPGPDYLWVPGHWAWSDWVDDYYWVAGYWDQPPEPELLWTPAWWGWDYGAYRFHDGYWGREVGWYGGVDYGQGYHGHGWEGGRWEHGHLAYNRAVINVTNVNVTNVYYQRTTVINNYGPRTSYNGGTGGVRAQPTAEEMRASRAPHLAPTPMQQQHAQQAAANPRNVAAHVVPNWQPPAVHRVGTDGTPVPRDVALAHGNATAGAPPRFQRQAPVQNPGRGGNAYGNMAPQPGTGTAGTPSPYQRPAYNAGTRAAPGAQPGYAAPGPQQQYQRPAYKAAPGYRAPGAPQQYQRPADNPDTGAQPGPAPRPAWQNRVPPSYQQVPRPAPQSQPAPGYGQAPRPAPAPQMFHPPAPAPQYHPAPPPPPRPAPAPAPAPKPQPRPDREHQ